jgi:probable HAF family extracellular repeat protein
MKQGPLACIVAGLSFGATSSFAQASEHKFEKYEVIDYPGAANTFVSGVNNRGQLVGQFTKVATGPGHAFTGEPGHLVPVDPEGIVGTSAFSVAYTLNSAGVIGGSYSADPTLGRGDHGYLLRHAEVIPVQYPGGLPTEVYGINDANQVIGGYFTADGNVHAFELEDGVFTAEDVPGSIATAPFAINDRGETAGFFATVAGTPGHGYIREPDGSIQVFDAPGAPPNSTQLIYVNDRDRMLGTYVDASGALVSFLRLRDGVDPITPPASLAAALFAPQAISDRGELAGFFSDASGAFHGFVARLSRACPSF